MQDASAPRSADAIASEKAALRARFSTYRAGLSAEAYAQRSAAILAWMRGLPELLQAEVVHLYWPLLHRREVDTRPLIAWLQARQKHVVLPVVRTFTPEAQGLPRLTHRRFASAAAMQPNRWGIHEPVGTDPVPLEQVDLIVVPALGAGRNGHRIGHGYGFYDELLGTLAVPSICPVYADCLVETVPAEAHDVPVSVIVTEQEVLRPRRM